VFGTGARMVEYVIDDNVTGYKEAGIGNVASNVLTRTQPRETWNGTTFDNTAPAALAFGSSPASGNIRIRMAPLAWSFTPNPQFHNSSIGDFNLGLMCGDINGGPTQSNQWGADQEAWYPYLWRGTREIDQFAVRAPVSNTGRSVKYCISEVGTNGLPGKKLIDIGTVSFNTSGTKTVTSSSFSPSGDAWLAPGYYYIGQIHDGTVDINTCVAANIRASILGMDGFERPVQILQRGSGEGASYASGLPDNPSGLSAPEYARPVVYLRPKA
jgi:hypothetical protein